MNCNGGYGNTFCVELPLEFLRPKHNGEFGEAITGHLWPQMVFTFTIEIINGAELDAGGEESVSPRRKLKMWSGLRAAETVDWHTFTIRTSEPGCFAVAINNGRRACVKAKGLR